MDAVDDLLQEEPGLEGGDMDGGDCRRTGVNEDRPLLAVPVLFDWEPDGVE